ncbi:MAG: anti-sigma factor family protein [Nitrospiraceae bacterium]
MRRLVKVSRETTGSHHKHGKRHCLKILQQLSAYLDDELPRDVCREIRTHLGACPNCEVFIESLRHTIKLCQSHAPHPLSAAARSQLRRQILRTATAR